MVRLVPDKAQPHCRARAAFALTGEFAALWKDSYVSLTVTNLYNEISL